MTGTTKWQRLETALYRRAAKFHQERGQRLNLGEFGVNRDYETLRWKLQNGEACIIGAFLEGRKTEYALPSEAFVQVAGVSRDFFLGLSNGTIDKDDGDTFWYRRGFRMGQRLREKILKRFPGVKG